MTSMLPSTSVPRASMPVRGGRRTHAHAGIGRATSGQRLYQPCPLHPKIVDASPSLCSLPCAYIIACSRSTVEEKAYSMPPRTPSHSAPRTPRKRRVLDTSHLTRFCELLNLITQL